MGIEASLQNIGYGLAGLAYLLLSVLLMFSFRGRLRGNLLTAASLVSVVWAGAMIWMSTPTSLSAMGMLLAEILHDAAWLMFLSALLSGAVGAGRNWFVRFGGILLSAGILALGVGQELYLNYDVLGNGSGETLVMGSLLTSLYALVVIEQIYRNARESQRHGLMYLCLGLGGIFAYDLFLYSNAILEGRISDLFWSARGYVVALCVPLIVLAAQRSPSWSAGIFISRQIVFYSSTLVGAGIYLTIVGFSGYYIREFGGAWGSAAQVVFFAAAIIGLFVFLFSDTTRARLRVFISKHFFVNKYDYRQEWLQLIDTLTTDKESMPLKKRAVKALVQMLDSHTGLLWLYDQESKSYRCKTGWNTPTIDVELDEDSPLAKFVTETGWVIDFDEYERDPSHYQDADFYAQEFVLTDAAYLVPLFNNQSLLGFVVLGKSARSIALNFEDCDLLKTAGQQIASYLGQEEATEQLAEGRQFEAFNRLTAYLMHDLKNIIAQQSLVVENAQKHKHNPAFIDDAIETIRGSVRRMRGVIEQLQRSSSDQPTERVELGKLVMQAVSQCADRKPAPRVSIGESGIWVRADRERLVMAVVHAVRNAQDATLANGSVTVSLQSIDDGCTVEIQDSGAGMSDTFIRERLFKPFDSTKGTQGMGIGAYQIRETLRALGGDVHVTSCEGEGTTVRMDLPLATGVKV